MCRATMYTILSIIAIAAEGAATVAAATVTTIAIIVLTSVKQRLIILTLEDFEVYERLYWVYEANRDVYSFEVRAMNFRNGRLALKRKNKYLERLGIPPVDGGIFSEKEYIDL
jgi:hypothetical protein